MIGHNDKQLNQIKQQYLINQTLRLDHKFETPIFMKFINKDQREEDKLIVLTDETPNHEYA